MAGSPGMCSVTASEDKERFFRLCRLLLDGGTDLLRQEFDKLIPPCSLPFVLSKEKASLLRLPRGVLTPEMFQKLYPTTTSHGKSTDFDISLLMVLFRHLCRLKAPPSSKNWSSMPISSDQSLEADILRLKIYRNTIFAHAEACCISENDFDQVSKGMCEIFERRGGLPWKWIAETMLNEELTECETAYLNKLKEWHSHDAEVKEIFQELNNKLDIKVNQIIDTVEDKVGQVEEKMDQMLQNKQEIKKEIANIASYITSQPFSGFSYQEFENFEEIGEGMFSKVFKVKHKRDRHTYALKRSHISIKKQVILDHFTKEVQMISCLVHDNVVRYFTSFVDHKNHFCILMECCRKDLASCFHSKSDMKNMIKPNSVQIFNDIICGLEYIHNQNIIHRDLTPENIFLPSLNDRCHAKIGDFGLSCYHDHSVMSYVGSRRYQAPEQASGKYDCKVDMYPAGIIFFELLKLDWEDPDDQTQSWIMILNNLRSDTKRLMRTFEPFHPKTAKKIILCLLKVNPKARLSATEVRRQLSGSPENECSTFSSTKSRRDSDWEVIDVKEITTSVAITGSTGSGMSTFMNMVCGLHPDGEEASTANVTPMPTDVKACSHPLYPNVLLCDLPGYGSYWFPAHGYTERLNLLKYNFYVICGNRRLQASDVLVLKKIQEAGKLFLFVLGRTDENIRDWRRSYPNFSEDEVIQIIRQGCISVLRAAGIKVQRIYLISNLDRTRWDFPSLCFDLLNACKDLDVLRFTWSSS